MLQASADAWNRGDLDGFLRDYAPDATFVGSRGLIHGVAEIRRMYAEGYWRTGTAPDSLRFEILDVHETGRSPSGTSTAAAIGRYTLYDRASGNPTGTGLFTLLLERNNGAWRILHDHSSAGTLD